MATTKITVHISLSQNIASSKSTLPFAALAVPVLALVNFVS